MATPNPKHIEFEERLKDVVRLSKNELGFEFPLLQKRIRSDGAVLAAKHLLGIRGKFSEGFKALIQANKSEYTIESVVLEFKDEGIFSRSEIETASWRLKNKKLSLG